MGVTCVKFLRISPHYISYAIYGRGIFVQKLSAKSFDKPFAHAPITVDDTIWDIHEHRFLSGGNDIPHQKPDYFLIGIGSHTIHILYDKDQGELGKLQQVDH